MRARETVTEIARVNILAKTHHSLVCNHRHYDSEVMKHEDLVEYLQ